jgi:hypothetical protein
MNSAQIYEALKDDVYTGPVFWGVFPIDKLPVMKEWGIYVVNTAPSPIKLGHWVAVINGIFFCSYGVNPVIYGLKPMPFVNRQLQSFESNTCGKYVVLFSKLICRGYTPADIIDCFGKIPLVNDKIISFV